jgi:hypothetical protein
MRPPAGPHGIVSTEGLRHESSPSSGTAPSIRARSARMNGALAGCCQQNDRIHERAGMALRAMTSKACCPDWTGSASSNTSRHDRTYRRKRFRRESL